MLADNIEVQRGVAQLLCAWQLFCRDYAVFGIMSEVFDL